MGPEAQHRCLTHPAMLCGYGVDNSDWTPIVVPNPPPQVPNRWEAAPEYIGVRKDGSWMIAKYRHSHSAGRSFGVQAIFARGMLRANAEAMAEMLNQRDFGS